MIAPETLEILSRLTGRPMLENEAKALFAELAAKNVFVPAAMVSTLIDSLQLGDSTTINQEEITTVFADILARDRHTGFYIHSALRNVYLDFARTRAILPGQQDRNFLILGDFLNLSNVNDAIGRSSTNDLMATVCGIYIHAMTRAGVVNWLFHRSMGDEVTFIVTDTDSARVLKGLHDAAHLTEEFTTALGLEHLRHKKYPDRRGAGLIVASLALDGKQDHRTLKLQLDEAVKQKKRHSQRGEWWQLGRLFKKRGVDPDQFHNRISEQRIDKALAKYKHYRNVAQLSGNAAGALLRNPLTPAQHLIVGRAIAWPRDDRIEYLRQHHDNTKTMLRADIYNLAGLNAVFGHDGADHIKSHLIRILYTTITAHYSEANDPKIFDCGGGIIDVVIDNIGNDHLQKLVETLQNNIHHQILSHSVSGYANAYNLSHSGEGMELLADLGHPKHGNKGTGLVMATHDVETIRSLPEIIERLDKITHRTKMHEFAYLWCDEDNNVFAFRLNCSPEPVFIGMDRFDPGLHYLPFTDALRQFVQAEDLPVIFERPVGQICEILFGTDMQAVLGFKKAIHLLQEKKIDDHALEAIDSYTAMNERLLAEDLPPLSVVSTQNRPAIRQNEHSAFRTMALAEKLEDLPHVMTSLILQAQAAFRTLKIIQPHGHLPATEARQILEDELTRFRLPKLDPFNTGEQLTESLYALVRLIDLVCAVLDREIPPNIRNTLSNITFETLRDLSLALDGVNEDLLAEKFRDFIGAHHPKKSNREEALRELEQELNGLVQKLDKKHEIDETQLTPLKNFIAALLDILRLHAEQRQLIERSQA